MGSFFKKLSRVVTLLAVSFLPSSSWAQTSAPPSPARPETLYPSRLDLGLDAQLTLPTEAVPDTWGQRIGAEADLRYVFSEVVSMGLGVGVQTAHGGGSSLPLVWEGSGRVFCRVDAGPAGIRLVTGALGGQTEHGVFLGGEVDLCNAFVGFDRVLGTSDYVSLVAGWRWTDLVSW